MAARPTGLFIIRAWWEPGSNRPLRAHVSRTNDVSLGVQAEQNFADPAAVCAAVQDWLDELSPN